LAVSSPGDVHEQEADRVADQVMHKSDSQAQRACACGGTCPECKHGNSDQGKVQSKQDFPGTSSASTAPGIVNDVVGSAGRALAPEVHRMMGSRFGHDFGGVRVHDDARASESARALGARAYTVGRSIVFGAGEYAPATKAGQHLLAHELTHVLQQRDKSPQTVQRSITLKDPGGTPPHPANAMGPFPSKAFTLSGWLHTLCPDGNWNVDGASGVVDSPDKATFCGAAPARGHAHHTTSAQPTSCGCLCELTAVGSRTIEVQIDENLTIGGASIPLVPQGEGATVHPGPDNKVSGFTGREFVGIPGAGATTPLAGAGRAQTLPDPPWIIFGHEVCGHARLQAGPMGQTQVGHSTTPSGNVTTVDIENRIRREHSTVAASLGIRGGTFSAKNAAGGFVAHSGSVFKAVAGDTISAIAARCGIPAASMLDHIWRSNGDQITAATQGTLAVGEELLVEGIDWHQVITGETMTTIAGMWTVPLASLQRANPQIAGPAFTVHAGNRLVIPAS